VHPRCRLLRRLLRPRAAAGHSLVAVLLLARKRQLRLRRLSLRQRGGDQRALPGEVGPGVVLPGAGGLLLRRRLRQRDVEFTRVDHRQQFPLFDPLVVSDQHLRNFTGNLRRNTRDIGANIGIIGILLCLFNKELIHY
jgi:hypothetical protein